MSETIKMGQGVDVVPDGFRSLVSRRLQLDKAVAESAGDPATIAAIYADLAAGFAEAGADVSAESARKKADYWSGVAESTRLDKAEVKDRLDWLANSEGADEAG